MPGCDGPVCLTRSAPFEVNAGQLLFYDVIDAAIVAQCSVLSCVLEGGGEAQLPNAISLVEFKTWKGAQMGHGEDIAMESSTTLCIVVKVADALDDKQTQKWVHLAANKLVQYAASNDRCDHQKFDAREGLSLLPDHLQHRVLAEACCEPSQMHSLLEFLPVHFHTAVLASTITPSKTLSAPLNQASYPFLKALVGFPSSPAQFSSLHVDDHKSRRGGTHSPNDARQQAAACVARVLQHHSSLSRFYFSVGRTDDASAMSLVSRVATLTQLQSLHLGGQHMMFPTATMPLLKQALRALPHLRDLQLGLRRPRLPHKRQRDAHAPAREEHCLASLLSPATALTSLFISASGEDDPRLSRFVAAAPLSLPRLSHLTAAFTFGLQLPSAFFSHLSAPLVSLNISRQRRPELIPNEAANVHLFARSLAKFTQLTRLCITFPTDRNHDQDDEIYHIVVCNFPRTLAAFDLLKELNVVAEYAELYPAMPLLAAGAPELTRLRFKCFDVDEGIEERPWPTVLHSVCQMKLQHLDVCVRGNNDDDRTVMCELPGLHALPPPQLTRLTALRTDGWDCLTLQEDCDVLARMTSLRHMRHIDGNGGAEVHISCTQAMAALPALTHLALDCWSVEERMLASLEPRVPRDGWPALQELMLVLMSDVEEPESEGVVRTLVRAAARLPALTKLTLDSTGVLDDPNFRKALGKICEGAGVELVFTNGGV